MRSPAPLVNEAGIQSTGGRLIPAYYMMAASAVGFVALRFVPEAAGGSLRGTEIPRQEESAS